MILALEGNNPNFHDQKRVKREWGKTKPYSNQLRTALQIDWATMHLRRIWSTHPSAFKHMGHALTTTLFRCCKLSKVRIAPRRAIHRNTITPGGAFNFQMLEIGLDYLNPSERTEKKDATEKEPSADGTRTLLYSPSSGMTIWLRVSQREKSQISFDSLRFLLKIGPKGPPHHVWPYSCSPSHLDHEHKRKGQGIDPPKVCPLSTRLAKKDRLIDTTLKEIWLAKTSFTVIMPFKMLESR